MKKSFKYLIKLKKSISYRFMPIFYFLKINFFWKEKPGKPHNLKKELIISLTSYPPRFKTLPLTLKCLLSQSIKPDKIILWIAQNDKSLLTEEILSLENLGLVIKYCEDLKSYKKIIPALRDNPNRYIVIADDDVYYWNTWLEELLDNYENDNTIIAHRAHHIPLTNRVPSPYFEWKNIRSDIMCISSLNFPTGIGGVLYPPHVFYSEVCNIEKFQQLCPWADDIWLYCMVVLNKKSIKKIPSKIFYCWPSSQKKSLWEKNVAQGKNDQQLKEVMANYQISLDIIYMNT